MTHNKTIYAPLPIWRLWVPQNCSRCKRLCAVFFATFEARIESVKYNKSISKTIEDYFIVLRKQNATELQNNLKDLYGLYC